MRNLKKTSLLILLGLIIFTACNDENATSHKESKKNDSFQNGTLTSLEGTVWMHHPHTDIESYNWLNLIHRPMYPYYIELGGSYPAKLSFTKDRIFDGSKYLEEGGNCYSYLYDYPKVAIIRQPIPCGCPDPLSLNKNTDCPCPTYYGSLRDWGFIGYVNETVDTMFIKQYMYNDPDYLLRDVVLIRVK